MLVTRSNFEEHFSKLVEECAKEKVVGFDTETTTLFWWQSPHYADKPRVFSMQFSTENSDYYFDFGAKESTDALGAEHFARFKGLFGFKDLLWFIQNAKFDMHHSYNHGLSIAGTVHCTQAIARVVNNEEPDCSLDGLSEKYLGANKIDLSKYWVPEEGRVTKVKRPGENGRYYDFLHFDRLPLPILVEYGERDTRLVYRLGKWQLAQIEKQNARYFAAVPSNFGGSLFKVLENERKLTKTLFWVERRGVQLDMPFVKEAHAHAIAGIKSTLAEIDPIAQPYVDQYNASLPKEPLKVMDWNSGVHMQGLFDLLGIPYTRTEKDSASFDEDSLKKSKSDLAKKVLEYRRHSKRAHTYLENYIWLADEADVLHCNLAQGGPRTGRMSCREPNLQNVPKRADKKEADFVLRKCFIARPGKVLVSKDYDQVEYRMMLDYSKEMALINRILNDGLDVHEATQQALNLEDRDVAKTMNFMLLYGGGVPKLAAALYTDILCSMEELKACWMLHKWPTWRRPEFDKDKQLRANVGARGELPDTLEALKKAERQLMDYFQALPNVKKFIDDVKKKAKDQGVIFTWMGRVLRYGPSDKGHTNYKAPNGLIQGGAGDLSKVAINAVHDALCEGYECPLSAKSYLILHVHDELVSEIDATELHIVPKLVEIMQKSYPHRLIPLTSGAAWSNKSWGELQDGLP